MSYLAVSKWARYQHYKSRKPPWIKFYVELVDDVQNPLNDLPVATRFLFDRLLLLAAKYDNAIPNDSELIARLLRMEPGDCREGLDQLLKGRWIQEKRTKRTAIKRASNLARKALDPELEVEVETPKPPSGNTRCPVPTCGVECKTVEKLEDHLANVHGQGGGTATVVEFPRAS